ncbi:UNVERIFIED_CONTAM: hypothetical protein GTU68_052480 [Idotea baltica]|nr:hypothetical protein [Idotea baltica]
MEIHHTKHHQGYINGLNKAEKELRKARIAGDYSLIQYWTKKASFNGGGHFLHSLFWKTMGPKSKVRREPNGKLMRLIKDKFGSFKDFKEQFTETAKSVEGSGWGLLHYRKIDESLLILQAENQNKLSPWGSTPILGIDVWEHAYYLKYKNKRADYIENWWNVVNWEQVEDNLEALL